ncbi:hypothetical protein CPB85DRAFT_393387 [Mucidula mucida]|nr:hypothetical protein CPB85DRAFT_393387 [Mucidula mucida]
MKPYSPILRERNSLSNYFFDIALYIVLRRNIEEVVAVCCSAYTNPEGAITDVLMRCYTGDSFKLLQLYMRAMTRATLLEGQIFIATDEDTFPGPIRSVALCFPPGKGLFVSEEQKALGYKDFESSITSETRAWWDMLNKETHDFMDGLKLSYLFMDGVWVSMMATDREFQNRGFGTAVIQDIKAYAAADNWAIGLMTHSESNRNWYASLDFKVAGVRNISAKPYETHFPCFAFAPYLPDSGL